MAMIAEGKVGSAGYPAHADVRIAVENFGPVEKGEIELRPLTILVGASNTGKTCFSVLIYSLHVSGCAEAGYIPGLQQFAARGRLGGQKAGRRRPSAIYSHTRRIVDAPLAVFRSREPAGYNLGPHRSPIREFESTLVGRDAETPKSRKLTQPGLRDKDLL